MRELFERVGPWVFLLAGLIVLGTVVGLALHDDPSRPVDGTRLDSCTAIDTAGRYVLTTDITDTSAGTCIRITASDVTLDGAGHTIDGRGSFGTAGVVVGGLTTPISNVSVSNVSVTEWDDGIRYLRVTDGAITATKAAHNRVGVTLIRSNRTRVSNSVARQNSVYGFSIREASNSNTIVNNRAANNTLFGIEVVANCSNNRLQSNRVEHNEHGLVLIGADNNTISNTTATDNRIAGIWSSESDGNRIVNNTVSNRFYGVYLGDQSNGNHLHRNTARTNRVGLRLLHSDGNVLSANDAVNNGFEGILLLASDDVVLRDNQLRNNGAGVVVARSHNITRQNSSASARIDSLSWSAQQSRTRDLRL